MEQLFLQESGIIDTKKISILYKDIDRASISKREYISKYLPSINDYRFFKFHLEVKDRVHVKGFEDIFHFSNHYEHVQYFRRYAFIDTKSLYKMKEAGF